MRKLTEKEIRDFINEWTWCTLVGVNEGLPYAVEVTYATDGEYIYAGSRPGGVMFNSFKKNNNIMIKICDADKAYPTWRAASIKGKVEYLTEREEVFKVMRMVAKVRNLKEDHFYRVAEYILKYPGGSSLFKVKLDNLSGVASH